jgi:hypothetical protein
LRDFDGDWAFLPATFHPQADMDWVNGLPTLEFPLDAEEMAGLARWADVPRQWLTRDVLGRLAQQARRERP